jgi:hypothetical protein
MKQFIKLFSILVVLSLIAMAPSQAQNVKLVVTMSDVIITQTQAADANGAATFTFTGGAYGAFNKEVVSSGGGTGTGKVKLIHKQKNVIEVAPQAVPAHLNHGDTIVPVASTATVTITSVLDENGVYQVTVQVSGVTSDVQVNLIGLILG